MTQETRLNLLIDAFMAEPGGYRGLRVPADRDGKRRLLRSMMNVRMPRAMDAQTLAVQDAYLRECAREKGIVYPEDIPPLRDGLSLWQGDLTRLAVDAIVNAANSQMLGCFAPCHNCIDNCIHTYAGVQLRAECAENMDALRQRFGRFYEQPTARPMLTGAYNLPAKKIIHIVGPIVDGALTPEHRQELADCYRNTLDLCAENGLRTVAFCAISTGVFHFPKREAAQIAIETVTAWLREQPGRMERIIFTVHSDESRHIYEQVLGLQT